LCGIESIAEAMRPAVIIGYGRQFSPEQIMVAMQGLPSRQKLNIETRAVVPVGNSILLATDIESGDAPALCERFVA